MFIILNLKSCVLRGKKGKNTNENPLILNTAVMSYRNFHIKTAVKYIMTQPFNKNKQKY